ncbi:MAG: tol-pal system-associated acyl-CoA thioesterase [Rhodospirillales bacterium]|nr:tol-pal system-associated acyl-CoA thioesterase [Rhodospirillales bacterium]
MPVRIYYEDTDAGGIVYYANYLRYAERGRTELLRSLGVEKLALMEREQLAFAVRGCNVEYLLPARLDDALEVHTRVLNVGGASLHLDQRVLRDGETLTEIDIRLVCMHINGPLMGRPSRIPTEVRSVLEPLCEIFTGNNLDVTKS